MQQHMISENGECMKKLLTPTLSCGADEIEHVLWTNITQTCRQPTRKRDNNCLNNDVLRNIGQRREIIQVLEVGKIDSSVAIKGGFL